jgi:hypothetical protein
MLHQIDRSCSPCVIRQVNVFSVTVDWRLVQNKKKQSEEIRDLLSTLSLVQSIGAFQYSNVNTGNHPSVDILIYEAWKMAGADQYQGTAFGICVWPDTAISKWGTSHGWGDEMSEEDWFLIGKEQHAPLLRCKHAFSSRWKVFVIKNFYLNCLKVFLLQYVSSCIAFVRCIMCWFLHLASFFCVSSFVAICNVLTFCMLRHNYVSRITKIRIRHEMKSKAAVDRRPGHQPTK